MLRLDCDEKREPWIRLRITCCNGHIYLVELPDTGSHNTVVHEWQCPSRRCGTPAVSAEVIKHFTKSTSASMPEWWDRQLLPTG